MTKHKEWPQRPLVLGLLPALLGALLAMLRIRYNDGDTKAGALLLLALATAYTIVAWAIERRHSVRLKLFAVGGLSVMAGYVSIWVLMGKHF